MPSSRLYLTLPVEAVEAMDAARGSVWGQSRSDYITRLIHEDAERQAKQRAEAAAAAAVLAAQIRTAERKGKPPQKSEAQLIQEAINAPPLPRPTTPTPPQPVAVPALDFDALNAEFEAQFADRKEGSILDEL